MAGNHRDHLALYRRLVVASIGFAVIIAAWLLSLGETAGALFLLALVVLAGLIVLVGPRLVRRSGG